MQGFQFHWLQSASQLVECRFGQWEWFIGARRIPVDPPTDMSCPHNELNPHNLIPTDLSNNHSEYLSKTRVQSSIPRAEPAPVDTSSCPAHTQSSNWMYPSEQMFYNAMKRKGAEPREQDMQVVVNIHNIVNEQCWREILKWEANYKSECEMPKLYRFLGRPDDLSPKAWLKHNILGYKRPFDRHDWYIDRCGQKIRYVIDFYAGGSGPDSSIAFHLDVRPALDTWASFRDRVTALFS